ncbi:unnamed protein product [Symbiodinium natans]|uniref:DRBM domain-containing protein n=1 Tax=Symbiodinium natans TaxID=878477 RepID=A0A812LMK6_9DINO|nr:unnamed protein product [Symbiodinium natans]
MAESFHIPGDLDDRLNVVKQQIMELYVLNKKFKQNFEQLSGAILHAQRNQLLDKEEILRLEELNRVANAAKHEGLGIDDPAGNDELGEDRDVVPVGDSVGELSQRYAKLLGRDPVKADLCFRYKPRPGNMGNFIAIACLQSLDPPVEFVGEPSRLKQGAKQSAAVKALEYLEAQGDNIRITQGERSLQRKRCWINVELSQNGLVADSPGEASECSAVDPGVVRNSSNAKGALLEFLTKEIRRPLEEEEVEWLSNYQDGAFLVTLVLDVEGWAVGSFVSSPFARKRDAEQDAAKLALAQLMNTRTRRPRALPTTLRLPADITVGTLLERYVPETIDRNICEVTWAGSVVDDPVPLGSLASDPLSLVLQERQAW